MSTIKDAYKALTPEQHALIESRQISGERPPDEWLELLIPVAQFEVEADAVRQAGGGGFFARRFARKHSLPEDFRSFAFDLLPTLREDHDPAAPLALKLDFTGCEQQHKLSSKSPPYKSGAYHKVIDSIYDDPLVDVQARFADGADVHIIVTDHIRNREKTKRNARGKTKVKVKAQCKTILDVAVTFPARNYNAGSESAAGEAAGTKEKVKAGERRTTVRLNQVVRRPDARGVLALPELIDLLARAYQRVEPARKKQL
jgi:hypothetical protein